MNKMEHYNLPVETYAYHEIVDKLVQRGYHLNRAEEMVRQSGLLDHAKKCGWAMFHTYGTSDWADWIISDLNSTFSINRKPLEDIEYKIQA